MSWIKLKDELPEVNVLLLLWVKCLSNPLWTTYKIGHYENDKFYLRGGTQYGEIEVTHWQLLDEEPI